MGELDGSPLNSQVVQILDSAASEHIEVAEEAVEVEVEVAEEEAATDRIKFRSRNVI